MNLWIAVPTFTATAAWVAASVFYAFRAKWWRTPEGRNAETVSVLIAVLLLRLSLFHLAPNHVDRAPTGFLVYSAATVVALWRIGLIEKAQRHIKYLLDNQHDRKGNT